jgi:hypothetical protein
LQYDLDAFSIQNGADAGYVAYGYEGPHASINLGVGPMPPSNMYSAGQRYGLALGGRGAGPVDGKMNGLHGPKHKRSDIDRECECLEVLSILQS